MTLILRTASGSLLGCHIQANAADGVFDVFENRLIIFGEAKSAVGSKHLDLGRGAEGDKGLWATD